MLKASSHLHAQRMGCDLLGQLALAGHWTHEIQVALLFYRPKAKSVVNQCNQDEVPILTNLPLICREDEEDIQDGLLLSA